MKRSYSVILQKMARSGLIKRFWMEFPKGDDANAALMYRFIFGEYFGVLQDKNIAEELHDACTYPGDCNCRTCGEKASIIAAVDDDDFFYLDFVETSSNESSSENSQLIDVIGFSSGDDTLSDSDTKLLLKHSENDFESQLLSESEYANDHAGESVSASFIDSDETQPPICFRTSFYDSMILTQTDSPLPSPESECTFGSDDETQPPIGYEVSCRGTALNLQSDSSDELEFHLPPLIIPEDSNEQSDRDSSPHNIFSYIKRRKRNQ